MAATRQPPGTTEPVYGSSPAPQFELNGSVRLGRKTKLMVRHLIAGEIAVIDHLDIDRVSAEELIAAEAVAVLNCKSSTSGTYPNLGPQLLVEAGVLLVDLHDDSLFNSLSDGDPLTIRVQPAQARVEVLYKGRPLASGDVLDLARVRAETEARRLEVGVFARISEIARRWWWCAVSITSAICTLSGLSSGTPNLFWWPSTAAPTLC